VVELVHLVIVTQFNLVIMPNRVVVELEYNYLYQELLFTMQEVEVEEFTN
jgi:hypothetical protein